MKKIIVMMLIFASCDMLASATRVSDEKLNTKYTRRRKDRENALKSLEEHLQGWQGSSKFVTPKKASA